MLPNLRKFLTLARIPSKKVPNHSPEHIIFSWILLTDQESDLAPFGEIQIFRGCPARAVLEQSKNVDFTMGEGFIAQR